MQPLSRDVAAHFRQVFWGAHNGDFHCKERGLITFQQ